MQKVKGNSHLLLSSIILNELPNNYKQWLLVIWFSQGSSWSCDSTKVTHGQTGWCFEESLLEGLFTKVWTRSMETTRGGVVIGQRGESTCRDLKTDCGIGHLERAITLCGGMTSSRGVEAMLTLTLLPFSGLLSCPLLTKLEARGQGSLLIEPKPNQPPRAQDAAEKGRGWIWNG